MAIAFDTQTRFPTTDTTGFSTTSGETLSATIAASASARGVVAVVFNASTADPTSSITYGGIAMELVVSAGDTTETGSVNIYQLINQDFPTGSQTFSWTRTATTTEAWVVVTTMTSAANTIIQKETHNNANTTTSANPSITLTTGVTTFVVGGMHGGAAAPTSYAPGTNYSTQFSGDYGAKSSRAQRSTTTIASGSPVYNFTYATSDDWCVAAAAYKEVSIPLLTQAAYRFYEDGTESGSTALGTQSTALSRDVTSNSNIQLRVRLQNTAAVAGSSTDDFKLQYAVNGGTWTDVGSGAVLAYTTANFTEGDATTNRLGAGTGSFFAGKASEDGIVNDLTFQASNYTELVYSLTLVAASLANSDTVTFRILKNQLNQLMWQTYGFTYTSVPTINVTKAVFTASQTAFRFYEDGTEAGSTAIDAQNTNITRTVDSNSNLLLRVRVQETGGISGAGTDDYQLQFSLNSGTWTNVGSGAVTALASANLTDGGATTNRLGAGTGSFVAGEISEDGLVDDLQLTASNYTELLYALTINSASVANNDTIDFRVMRNGATITYSVTPRANVAKTPVPYSFEETFDDTNGTTISSGNSGFDIYNGSGTSQYTNSPAAVNGTTCAAFNATGGVARWMKNSTTLPGSVNGGTALKVIYSRFYVRASVAVSAITRIHIFEESVAAGGADVGGIRINATGAFAIMDSTTSRGASTRTISTTEWTRVELMLNQNTDTITARLWWGSDLHNASTGATNYETWTGTLNLNNNDFQVFGIGVYATGAATNLYVDELKLSDQDWVGPATISDTTQTYFGIPMA